MPKRQTSAVEVADEELADFSREHFDNPSFLRTNAGARQVLLALEAPDDEDDEDAPPAPTGLLSLPSIPQLMNCSPRIAAADEAEIRWRFANPHVAYIRQSSGDFGRQLEHAEAFGYGALPCRACGGRWRSKRMPKGRSCPDCLAVLPANAHECPRCRAVFGSGWQDGTGQAPKPRLGKHGKRVSYATALAEYRYRMQREHGIVLMSKPAPSAESGIDREAAWKAYVEAFEQQGKRLLTDGEFRAMFARLPDEECESCSACGGIGVVPRRSSNHGEVTAFPTGNSKQVGGREAQTVDVMNAQIAKGLKIKDGSVSVILDDLERWVTVETILADVAGLAMIARIGLEEFYTQRIGHVALLELCPGPDDSSRARATHELVDFMSRCYNLCAYGAKS